jgi:hypothetical protein
VLGRNRRAHGLQIFRQRAVQAAADQQIAGRDVKIEPRAFVFAETAMWENRGHMRLVRALVLRESRIAIDAIQARSGRGLDFGREAGKFRRQKFHKFFHWLPDGLFVLFLMRKEPIAVVVPLQGSEEAETRFRKV